MPVELRDVDLVDWQRDAVNAWIRGDGGRAGRGTLEIVTGGGKTLMALACIAWASEQAPDLKVAIVVPSGALVAQWRRVLERHTSLQASDIGVLGAGHRPTSFEEHRVIVAVLNSAAKRLPELAAHAQPLMLVVDECHRAGAPTFARVLSTPSEYRLGLSATPDREEFDDNGEPLAYDEQLVGKALGRVVYEFNLGDARRRGWLPDFEIHHHGLALTPDEQVQYDRASREVDDLGKRLKDLGGDTSRAQQLQARGDEVGKAARAFIAATSQRKDVLYRASERARIAAQLVRDEMVGNPDRRILMFHERVDEAVALYRRLLKELPDVTIALEHSRLSDAKRARALDEFRSGEATVLVSVKSLVEGIDVPAADVGISVASTSSVRQRIQSLGRVLRRSFTGAKEKRARMHVLYVADTVDELIYAKEDWTDLTGGGANFYWRWPLDEGPQPQGGPPAEPRPSEDQEWRRLGCQPPVRPEPWLGSLVGQEYSVDTLGTVSNSFGTLIANTQGVAEMVTAVRGRPGGRFRITPQHRLVLVRGEGQDSRTFVAGQLAEPFRPVEDPDDGVLVDTADLHPGDPYLGPATRTNGTFKLRQKRGGVIERRGPDGSAQFAETTGHSHGEANARATLEAWRRVSDRGMSFSINELDHAWYTEGGTRRFLAEVPGGFSWPTEDNRGDDR